jgi:uncharacterized protein
MKKEKNISQIQDFMKLRSFALFGASSKKRKFGNLVLSTLAAKGYTVFPIHKTAYFIDGIKCYNSFDELPYKPDGVILVIPPDEAQHVVNDIISEGIKNVWFQQGSESAKAVNYCILNGLNVIYGECILMFTEKPGFPHNLHKWVWGLGAKSPSV